MASGADCIQCSLCSFRTITLSEWVSHLRLVHCNDSEFTVTCGINGCVKIYKKCSSFLSHVYRCHRETIIQNKTVKDSTVAIDESLLAFDYTRVNIQHDFSAIGLFDCTSASGSSSLLQHTVHQLLGIDELEQKKKSALFILHLKEIKSLSETAVQTVISGCKDMLIHGVKRIQARVYDQLTEHGVDPQVCNLGEDDPITGMSGA